ncbi:unnamed protein product [Rhizophagus irregularis]|nr:unnamed protein product [Rhizophagus irregularis]
MDRVQTISSALKPISSQQKKINLDYFRQQKCYQGLIRLLDTLRKIKTFVNEVTQLKVLRKGEEIILEDNRAMNEFLDRIESGTVNNHNQINAVLNGIVVMKSQLASLESQFTAFAATQNQN